MSHFLTEDKLAELKAELEELVGKKRIEISERLKRAKELGDLSENAEYLEARNEQERVENRIDELKEIIENAEIIHKGAQKLVVGMGSSVDVSKDGEKKTFFLVGSSEAKPEEGYISNESPLGTALMNRRVGETVTVETPDKRKIEYKILAIN